MDSNPYVNLNFSDLLQSQVDPGMGLESSPIPLFGMQATEGSNFDQDSPMERKERRTWTPSDDLVLISAWLNTSKDPIVGNEQRVDAFWKRVAAYFSASPKISACDRRDSSQCKQRWHKMNELVMKFCGAYESASREKRSGQNENDVLRHAYEIFQNNHKKKFTLEHAWRELRNDQKWSDLSSARTEGSSKRRKCDDGSYSASSQANENDSAVADEGNTRPMGVKAAKARGKKLKDEGKELSQFQTMWRIKQEDLATKEKLSKMKLLDSLLAKPEPLADCEESLKKKLINELLSN